MVTSVIMLNSSTSGQWQEPKVHIVAFEFHLLMNCKLCGYVEFRLGACLLGIFSSLLTIGDSFAKNLNLLAQKEKNNILH
jgi:hypothetical protein